MVQTPDVLLKLFRHWDKEAESLAIGNIINWDGLVGCCHDDYYRVLELAPRCCILGCCHDSCY